jgi:Uma2 family endonuclease
MGMAASYDFCTGDMVRALNEAEPRNWPRYETVHGELLVSPAPRVWHQRVVTRLVVELCRYIEREPVGEAFVSPADISWGLPDVLTQPDVFVVPAQQSPNEQWSAVRQLLLAVEGASPSTVQADRFTKRRLYQEQGTPLYWLLDPEARSAEIWTPTDSIGRIERERLVWTPNGASLPFELALADLFRPV